MSRRRGARLRLLVTAGILAAVVAGTAQVTGALEAIELASVDERFRERPAAPPSDVIVVAVDDVSFSELGRQWPFPRSLFGRAVDRLHAAGAREIVLDVQFTEPTRPGEDFALYEAIRRAGGAVLATSESDGRGGTNVLGGDENLAAVDAQAAASNLPDEHSGRVIRRFTHSIARLPTLAVAVAERQGRDVSPGAFEPGGSYIDFRGPPGTIRTVSFSALVRGEVAPGLLRDKIVVVGASAPTLHDQHATPTSSGLMSGPEVQANAIWTLLHGLPLTTSPAWLSLLAILVLSMLPPLIALKVRAVIALLAAPAIALGYLELTQAAFDTGTVVPVVAPLFGLALAAVATVVASHLLETVERHRIAEVNDMLAEQVRDRTRDLRDTELEMIQRLGQAVESRDEETGDHIRRITSLCHRLALAAGLSIEEAELVQRASAMHDVGKIAIPDEILRKPGPLAPEERAIMQRHTTIGARLLSGSRSPLVQMAETIARTHHERWDGTGYPAHLAGEEIPLAGRICALCDVFDALVSKRPYKPAWPVAQALEEIRRGSGSQFDPHLTRLFLDLDLETDAVAFEVRRIADSVAGAPALSRGNAPAHVAGGLSR
jgi:response regulator RpfG family c-di-GMP phosphodiesterase